MRDVVLDDSADSQSQSANLGTPQCHKSLAKPASPLRQAQNFYCATLNRDFSHLSSHIKSSNTM